MPFRSVLFGALIRGSVVVWAPVAHGQQAEPSMPAEASAALDDLARRAGAAVGDPRWDRLRDLRVARFEADRRVAPLPGRQPDFWFYDAIESCRRDPPTMVEEARRYIGEVQTSGYFQTLDELLRPPFPGPSRAASAEELTRMGGLARQSSRLLLARMRLQSLDGRTDKALESFDLALRSGRQVFVMLTKLDLTIAASLWLGALEELRFQAGEQAFTDAQLAAADASICAWLPDRSGLCTLIEDTISAENVVHQASLEEWLTKLDENTPEGREKYAREFLENCQALRRAVCGPLTTDGKPIDPMSVVSDAAGVTSDDPKTQARAIQKIASALNNAADTSLRLLIMNTEGVRVLLAIHRFKIQYGRVPASLDAIPVELFGARPPVFEGLVYRTGEDGKFTLYALGENGRDDGGKGRSLSNPTATADECFTAGRAERWK